MAGIRLEWAQFGQFDSFDVIRSSSSMSGLDESELPDPLVTGLTTMYYEDTSVVPGEVYYYLIRVWRDGETSLSEEGHMIASPPWLPSALTLAVWLDAKDLATITKDSGTNKVSAWNDKSGNGRHAIQADSSKQPVYDTIKQCIAATGTVVDLQGSFVDIPIDTINEYTLFVVAKPTKASSWVDSPSSSGVNFYNNANNNSTIFQIIHSNSSSTSGVVVPVFSITTNATSLTETRNALAPYLISRGHALGSQKMLVSVERKNTGAIRSGLCGVYQSAASSSVLALGWEYYSVFNQYVTPGEGELHEVILIHSGSIGDTDIQKIEGYLAHKWDIASLLPSDHPYKSEMPYA